MTPRGIGTEGPNSIFVTRLEVLRLFVIIIFTAFRLRKDHATNNFLQWFVAEQVEEESSADEVVQKLKIAGDQGGGLFMLDRELGQRVFTPPATEK